MRKKPPPALGLELARSQLPTLVSQAHAGESTIITRHGRPMAAIIPASELAELQARDSGGAGSLLALRATGKGLWRLASDSVAHQRGEWQGRLG